MQTDLLKIKGKLSPVAVAGLFDLTAWNEKMLAAGLRELISYIETILTISEQQDAGRTIIYK